MLARLQFCTKRLKIVLANYILQGETPLNPFYFITGNYLQMENKQEYQQEYWKKNKGKYHRFTLNLSDGDFERLEELEKVTGYKKQEILKKALKSALSDEKLVLGIETREKEEKEQIGAILRVLGGIGTNINQVAHGLNTRRLAGSILGGELKKDERQRIMRACEELEQLILELKK